MRIQKLTLIIICLSGIINSAKTEELSEIISSDENHIPEIQEGESNWHKLLKNQPKDRFVKHVQLQLLNKITGKALIIEAAVGETIIFEKLMLQLLHCWKSYPDEYPENKLLLKIHSNNDNLKKLIFYGWIFSSSPSVFGLEHPVYYVELKNCSN
jgi:hypothetical protein